VPQNQRDNVLVSDPKTIEERRQVAADFAKRFKLTLPVLVDTMDDQMNRKYAAWPDRLYVIDAAGKLAYVGRPGPGGFKVNEVPPVLERLLRKN
jgi:hypothetical protein